jgi:hypothetical protein
VGECGNAFHAKTNRSAGSDQRLADTTVLLPKSGPREEGKRSDPHEPHTERAALAVLTGLAGVDVPVAFAILTVVDPARFTIIDFRALWSLGVEGVAYYPVGFYLDYFAACRRIAADAGTDLRSLDRALWRYSKENQPPVG